MYRLITGLAVALTVLVFNASGQLVFDTTVPENYTPGETITVQLDVSGTVTTQPIGGFAITVKDSTGSAPTPAWIGTFPGSGTNVNEPDAFAPDDSAGLYQFVYAGGTPPEPPVSLSLDLAIPAGFVKDGMQIEFFLVSGTTVPSIGLETTPVNPTITLDTPGQTEQQTSDPDTFNAANKTTAGDPISFTVDLASGSTGATLALPVTVEANSATLGGGTTWSVDGSGTVNEVNDDSSSGDFSWTFDGSTLSFQQNTVDTIVVKGEDADDRVVGFKITVNNSFGGSAETSIFNLIAPVNQPPVITQGATGTIAQDEGATGELALDGTDADDPPGELTWDVTTDPTNGAATFVGGADTANGAAATVQYTPTNPDFFGTDSFVVTLSDDDSGSDTITVNVTVANVNDDPTAGNDTATVQEDSGNNVIDVLANDNGNVDDTPPAGFGASDEVLTVADVEVPTAAANGTVTNNGTSVSYQPDDDFFGTDSFSYSISDGNGGTATATVTVNVANVNDDPVANDDTDSMDEDDGPINIDVLDNDDGDVDDTPPAGFGASDETLDIIDTGGTPTGTVTIVQGAPDTLQYDPPQDFVGIDTFTYAISDGNSGTDTATVTVTVTNVNDPPVLSTTPASATNFFLRKPDDPDSSPLATVEIDLATFVSDVDFATGHDLLSDISYTITQAPTRGTFVANTTASLAGEWFIGGSNLQDNQTWSGTVTFNAAGNVTAGSVTSSAGLTHTIVSGSFTASALGEVTGSFTDNRATAVTTTFTMQMDSGQGTMAGEGNANPAESEDGAFVFIKKSAQFALDPDLAGTWFIGGSDLQDDHTWDGELTIDTAGNVTGGTYNSSEGAGGTPITGGSFSFGANGAVTGQFIDDDGAPVTTDLILQMDYRKGIMAGPGKAVASTEEGMFVFVKKVAPNFVTADLEGTWFLGGSDLEEEDTWDAGVTLDNTGAVIAPFLTYNSSAGPPNSPITGGSFTITAAGSVTGQVTDNDGGGPVTTSFTLQMNDEKDMMGGEGNVTFPVDDGENGFFMLVKAATAPETGQFTYTVDDAEKNAEFYDGNAGNQADIIQFTVSDGEDASNLGQIGIDYRSNVPPVVTAVSPGSDATTPQDQAIDEVDAEGAAVTLAFSASGTDIDDPTNPNTGTDPNIASIAWTIDGGAAVQTDADVTSSSYTFSTTDLYDTVTGDNATRVIAVTANITDGEGATTEVTWDVTVTDIDREPPSPTIAIQPATPMTLDDLSVLITEQVADPDGDVVDSYTYVWEANAAREAIDTDINSGNVLENASNSAATGTGVYVIDTDNNLLHYTITFSGLEGDETAAHIHGFADVDAAAAQLEVLPLGSPKSGTWNYDEGEEANILAGLTYVNIHSTSVVTGEIRGQVYPASVDGVQAHAATRKGDQWTVTVTAITHPYNDAVEVTSDSVSASVTIIDTPPDAVDGASTDAEETAQAVVVSAIDPDADDGIDALTYSIITGPTAAQGTATIVDGNGTNGAAVNEALLTFTPAQDFATYPPGAPGSNVPVEIIFQVQDNPARDASPTGTVSFTVVPVNDPPVAANGSIFAQHNTADTIPANTVDLFAGNHQTQGGTATLLGDDVDDDNESTNLIYTVDTLPAKGTLSSVVANVATALAIDDLPLTVTDQMNLRYQPDVDAYGADTFLFSVEDDSTATDQAQVSLMIPEQPVVTAVSPGSDATTPQDQAINEVDALGVAVTVDFSVSATDIDDPTNPDTGSGANIASITWTVDAGAAAQTDNNVSSSSYTFSTADTGLYDTVTGDNETRAIVITAKITDGEAATTVVTWNVTVTDVDRQPPPPSLAIQPAAPMTSEDLTVVITEQLPDPDGDTIDGYTYAWAANAGPTDSTTTVQANAATRKNDQWTITVTAITHPYSDAVETASDPASASVTIVNTPPDAVDDVSADDEDTVQTIVVTAIDPDVDDSVDALTYSIITGPTAAQGTATIVDGNGTNGAAVNEALLTFTPAQDFATHPTGDPVSDVPVVITFQVQDNLARNASPNGTVSFTVNPINDSPVALTGSAFVQANKADTDPPNTVELYAGNNLPLDERAALLGDDVDDNNESTNLTYTVDSLPVKGTLSSVVGGAVTALGAGDLPLTVTDLMNLRYQPDVDENGTDIFLFSVQDVTAATTQGQVNLTIGTPQWTPPLNWIAPDLGGGVHPFFYLLTIQGEALPAPLVGEIRDLDIDDNIVTVQPEFYFAAGSSGLLPGDYTFSWEYFDNDPAVNAFVAGDSGVAFTVDDYGQPTVPAAPVVTEPAGRAVERNRIFTFLPENAAGWIMVIQRMDGDDRVDFLTLTERFSRDTSADELPPFPLNVSVSKTLFFSEPGTYQATVRGFNPLAPQPAADESDAHGDLFSDFSASFTVEGKGIDDVAARLPAPENLLAQLLGDEGDKTVRLTWTGVTSRYRVHLRARRGARILLTRAMRVNGTSITMPRTAADADQLVDDGVVPESDARLLRSLEEIFGDAKLVPNAYDWSVLADDGDADFSPWALVNGRMAKFTVNAPLSDKVPGTLIELFATFDLDTAVLGLVDVTFTATVDPGLPVDSVTVVIGEPRKGGLRHTLDLAPGAGDSYTAVASLPIDVTYGYRGYATSDGVKGPPTEVFSLPLNKPIGPLVPTADTNIVVTLPDDADPDGIYEFQIAELDTPMVRGTVEAVAGVLTIAHGGDQEIATAGHTYYVRVRPAGVFGAWTDWTAYTP